MLFRVQKKIEDLEDLFFMDLQPHSRKEIFRRGDASLTRSLSVH
jgi:hypothetical protein